ncbi:hypothetical protein AMATHDRAFT_75041 [Amanita thiersii Skay4041]|uniref:RING-type domain-containing protein n=1 Tax=Amanita thiersii Skay4041 TaxID=703135 RepID=A0A2A9NSS0_9AGAR|nr:hypothetical protein AMATHDRAFT_75041 [Amanita thiersii Skay4041]
MRKSQFQHQHGKSVSKRAEVRVCPVCDESIPLRLLAKHALLEDERLSSIIQHIGSTEPLEPSDDMDGHYLNYVSSSEKATKLVQTIKRHRKQRHSHLRDLYREFDDEMPQAGTSRDPNSHGQTTSEIQCPVCLTMVHGDEDVVDAHIDACLADRLRREDEAQARALEEERAWESSTGPTEAVGHVGDVTGTGFHTRNPDDQDVDDDIDIDGDDQAVYGEAQFTEGDVISLTKHMHAPDEDIHVEIEGEIEDDTQATRKTLHELVAEGKVVRRRSPSSEGADQSVTNMNRTMSSEDMDKVDLVITSARNKKDRGALITALENKIQLLESMHVASSSTLSCRICLDPYTEPTVSTGCWHTCCQECWLRCLGSTKLCPICKRITNATDLRRIYL